MFALNRTLAALVLVAAPALAQESRHEGPTPEEIKAAVAACKEGLKSKEASERQAAVEAAAKVDADAVAAEIAHAMKDKEDSVAAAAMKALGSMHSKDALKELHRHAKGADKKLIDNGKLYGTLLRNIALHGDKSSIEVLGDDAMKNTDADVARARIYGLGNIRDKAAVEKLIDLTSLGNPLPGEDSPYMPDVRVALARLTGTDQTTNKSMWQEWWNKNKHSFKVSEMPPELAPELQRQWDEYWAGNGGVLPKVRAPEGEKKEG